MYLGRHMQGQEVALRFHLADGSRALLPSGSPRVAVYDADGVIVARGFAYQRDRVRAPSLFCYRLFLASGFVLGRYMVSFTFADSDAARTQVAHFDVIAGDAAGAVVSQYFLRRPHADTIVQKTASGRRFLKRSPYL